MPGRTRTSTKARNQGYWQWDFIGDHYTDGVDWTETSTCVDTYKDGTDNQSFSVNRRSYSGCVVNTDPFRNDYDNRTFSSYAGAVNGPFALLSSFPGMDTTGNYASRTAARTNPSRPVVDVPAELLQLGDIFLLIKQKGDTLLPIIGGQNLRFQFGVLPLIEDLEKLLHFTEHVARRVKELRRLTGPRGFRKTVELDSWGRVDTPTITWNSAGSVFMQAPTNITRTFTIKGHARWKTSTDFSKLPTVQQVALAKRAVVGLTIDSATLWEAIPFSWLIDWGINISAFLYAHRNIIPAYLDSLSIIKHETARADFIPKIRVRDHEFSGGQYFIERKERIPAAVAPTAHFPFLTGNQMGILASLYVTGLR